MSANKLIGALLTSNNGMQDYFKLNLDPVLFKGPEVALYQLVHSHVMKYGALPSKHTIDTTLGVAIPTEVPEPAAYYRDGLIDRHIHLSVKKALLDAQEMLNAQKPHEALQRIKTEALTLHLSTNQNKIIDYAQEGHAVITGEIQKKLLLGDAYGLKLGWPTLDNMIGGLQGGDILAIVGRPSMGKTYMMLYGAIYAWHNHKIPKFTSMEMKPLPIIQRVGAIDTTTSITEIKQGTLSTKKAKQMVTQLKSNKTKQPFWIIDGALTSTVDDLIMYCAQFKPDVLFIDGAYLLKSSSNMPRWERISDNIERIKGEIAEAFNIPVIVSYQFNRATKNNKKEDPGLHNIAGSDAVGQIATVVLGLLEEESVETMERRKVSILKGRNGESGQFYINWIFDKPGPNYMNFSEIIETEVSELQFI